MRYIGGHAREDGCIFCNRLAGDDDVDALVLHRSTHAFVIMNLFPYNTGHVMIVPNRHAADVEALDDATLVDMARLLPRVVEALRSVFGCEGFNIGLNLGSVAGAGVAEHLHQHVVPRWEGDANFMPILAGTMVIPEMIPASYAKIRLELERRLGARQASAVVITGDGSPDLWLQHGTLPSIPLDGPGPGWKAVLAGLALDGAEIVGWAGGTRASNSDADPGLIVRVERAPATGGWQRMPLVETIASPSVSDRDRETIARAERHRRPWVGAPDQP